MPAFAARLGAFASLAFASCVCSVISCTLLTSLDGLSDGAPSGGDASGSDGGDERLDGGDAATADAKADAAASRYASAVLADNPLLYFRFGEKTGAAARDEVTGAVHAYPPLGVTLGAAGGLTGDGDTAIALDGTGKIVLTHDADFLGMLPFSVEAWVSRSTSVGDVGFLVDHQAWTGGRRGWSLRAYNDGFGFERTITPAGATSYDSVSADEPVVAGEWHHIVATFDGTTQHLYVDAVRRAEHAASIALPAVGPFTVGNQNCSPCSDNGFVGTLDELAIYAHALNDARVLAHFQAGKGL
jgi:large repetitive protein